MDGRPSRRHKDAFQISNFCLRNSVIRGLFQIVEIGQNGMLTRTNAGRLIWFFAHLELEFIYSYWFGGVFVKAFEKNAILRAVLTDLIIFWILIILLTKTCRSY